MIIIYDHFFFFRDFLIGFSSESTLDDSIFLQQHQKYLNHPENIYFWLQKEDATFFLHCHPPNK